MKFKANKGFKKFLAIFMIFIVLSFAFYFWGPYLPFIDEYVDNQEYIAVLYMEGVIMSGEPAGLGSSGGYNHEYIVSQIDSFISDELNQGLVLFIDSPGGGIYETDEVYLKLLEYKQKTGCPVYVSMGSMAASGGYYISTMADKVYANRNTITGSIGVTLGTFYDISDFLEEHGIKTITMTAGKNKAMGEITKPMSDEQKAILQSMLDESYDQFVEVIVQGRNLKVERVREIADGRIYTAKQAKQLDLIDEIGTLDDTIDAIITDNGLEHCEIYDYWYEDDSLMSLITGMAEFKSQYSSGDLGIALELLNRKNKVPVSYMCDWLIQ